MTRRRNTFEFADVPPIGLSILVNDQRFDLVGHETHEKLDGCETTLLVWQAECATCGAGFVTRSPSNAPATGRRCEKHRQPGRRVTPRDRQT